MVSRWSSMVAVLVMLTIISLGACGGDEKPSDTETIGAAATDMLKLPGYLATTTLVQEQETLYQLREEINFSEGERLIVGSEGPADFQFLYVDGGTLFLKGSAAELNNESAIAGRWVRLTPDQAKKLLAEVDQIRRAVFSGPSVEFLNALKAPGKTTVIGREVVAGKASKHYLTDIRVPAFADQVLSVEVWVTDEGDPIQIKTLVQAGADAPSELTILLEQTVADWESVIPAEEDQIALDDLEAEAERIEDEAEAAAAEAVAEEAEAAAAEAEAAAAQAEAERRAETLDLYSAEVDEALEDNGWLVNGRDVCLVYAEMDGDDIIPFKEGCYPSPQGSQKDTFCSAVERIDELYGDNAAPEEISKLWGEASETLPEAARSWPVRMRDGWSGFDEGTADGSLYEFLAIGNGFAEIICGPFENSAFE